MSYITNFHQGASQVIWHFHKHLYCKTRTTPVANRADCPSTIQSVMGVWFWF